MAPDWWRKMTCTHTERTAPDDHGYAICLKCGEAIPVVLTKYQLDKAFEDVMRPE